MPSQWASWRVQLAWRYERVKRWQMRPTVVDDVVLNVVWQTLAAVDALLELGVGDIAGHNKRARQCKAGAMYSGDIKAL